MRMIVPRDLEARSAVIIGAPFLAKGDAPDGWDCRGLARWCLREWCGVEVPDYQALYAADIVCSAGRRTRAALLAQGLGEQWRPVEPQAGAVALLEWMGAAGHVGFMLSPRRLLHADTRCGTALLDLDDPAAGYRLRAAFVPAFITEIFQEDR